MLSSVTLDVGHAGSRIEAEYERAATPAVEAGELRFGRYRVIPGARQVLSDGRPLKLGSRAFDMLVVLLKARGTIVSREEIIRQVWPSTTVDETNLRFQMGVLRRALGPDRPIIKTVPGRGYLLAIDVGSVPNSFASTVQAPGAGGPGTDRPGGLEPFPYPAGRQALRDMLHAVADEFWRAIVQAQGRGGGNREGSANDEPRRPYNGLAPPRDSQRAVRRGTADHLFG